MFNPMCPWETVDIYTGISLHIKFPDPHYLVSEQFKCRCL